MRKWEPVPTLIPAPVDSHQYEQSLAEVAEILYKSLKLAEKVKNVSSQKPELSRNDCGSKQEARYE